MHWIVITGQAVQGSLVDGSLAQRSEVGGAFWCWDWGYDLVVGARLATEVASADNKCAALIANDWFAARAEAFAKRDDDRSRFFVHYIDDNTASYQLSISWQWS